jgi:hypothetical protein
MVLRLVKCLSYGGGHGARQLPARLPPRDSIRASVRVWLGCLIYLYFRGSQKSPSALILHHYLDYGNVINNVAADVRNQDGGSRALPPN